MIRLSGGACWNSVLVTSTEGLSISGFLTLSAQKRRQHHISQGLAHLERDNILQLLW